MIVCYGRRRWVQISREAKSNHFPTLHNTIRVNLACRPLPLSALVCVYEGWGSREKPSFCRPPSTCAGSDPQTSLVYRISPDDHRGH